MLSSLKGSAAPFVGHCEALLSGGTAEGIRGWRGGGAAEGILWSC